jgi:hypothetical protein
MEPSPGLYRHYKGGYYRVLFIAYESTNGLPRTPKVVYVSLDGGAAYGRINVREVAEFNSDVTSPGGFMEKRFFRMGN